MEGHAVHNGYSRGNEKEAFNRRAILIGAGALAGSALVSGSVVGFNRYISHGNGLTPDSGTDSPNFTSEQAIDPTQSVGEQSLNEQGDVAMVYFTRNSNLYLNREEQDPERARLVVEQGDRDEFVKMFHTTIDQAPGWEDSSWSEFNEERQYENSAECLGVNLERALLLGCNETDASWFLSNGSVHDYVEAMVDKYDTKATQGLFGLHDSQGVATTEHEFDELIKGTLHYEAFNAAHVGVLKSYYNAALENLTFDQSFRVHLVNAELYSAEDSGLYWVQSTFSVTHEVNKGQSKGVLRDKETTGSVKLGFRPRKELGINNIGLAQDEEERTLFSRIANGFY